MDELAELVEEFERLLGESRGLVSVYDDSGTLHRLPHLRDVPVSVVSDMCGGNVIPLAQTLAPYITDIDFVTLAQFARIVELWGLACS